MTDTPSIVRTITEDNLYLHGFYSTGLLSRPALLFIHGFEGSFFDEYFSLVLAQKIPEAQFGFLSGNTRGYGKETDFLTTSGESKTIGSRYELLDEALKDIDGWIEFLMEKGYDSIILSGHSLGTYKAVRYVLNGRYAHLIKKLILLSPFDQIGLLATYTPAPVDELLKKAERKVAEGHGDELITKEYESIRVSYKTYISWYNQDELGLMFNFSEPEYTFPALRRITQPTKVIVGSEDPYFHPSNPKNPDEAMDILKRRITNFEGKIIDGVGYSFSPKEEALAAEIIHFLQK